MSTDLARLHAVFDLAMRIGEGMLSNGAPASEVTATVLRVISSSGIRHVSVQVTFDEVAISHLPDATSAPFTRIRAAGHRIQDFSRLEVLEDVADRYVRGDLPLDQATAIVVAAPHQPQTYPSWLVNAGLAVMGGGAALGFGAGTLVVVAAAITAGVLGMVIEALMRRRLPLFYVQAAGGFIAVLATLLVHAIDPSTNSSVVVVSCIIILLAGLTSLGAMQDAVTGWYVTASARILETLMLTIGVVVGVRGGLLLAQAMDADISVSAAMPLTLASVLVLIVSGAVTGLGYAVTVQTPARLLAWCSGIAALSSVVSTVLTRVGMERSWAVGLTALGAGVIAVMLAPRLRTPSISFVMAGVIPLVPGSRIYRGLLAISEDLGSGAAQLFGAAEIAVALAAGAVFGQLLGAQLLRIAGRAGSVYMPVVTGPFTTLPRRRRAAVPRPRAGRRGGSTMGPEKTLTSSIPVVAPDVRPPDPPPGRSTDRSQESP